MDTADETLDGRCQTLIRAMASGDEQALGTLYDLTLSRVYAVALRILNEPALAEETVTDVYFAAWKNAGAYRSDRGSALSWLLMQCRSRALDAYRHRAGMQRKADAAANEADVEVNEPEDILTCLQDGNAVHELLAALPFDDRQLITLAFFRDFSHAEIAACTGQPLGTVKSRIRRTLAALGNQLDTLAAHSP